MTRRIDRVNELLRSELSQLIARELKDPRVSGVITITEVVASSDLRSARVYVSVMGGDAEQREALEGIRSAASFLRRELRERINLRHAPHMTFLLDDSIAEGDRVLRLLDGVPPEPVLEDLVERAERVRRLPKNPSRKGK